MATPLILANLDGDTNYADGGSGGTGTPDGAVRWADGHTGGVQAAILEEGTVNGIPNPSGETDSAASTATWYVTQVQTNSLGTTTDGATHGTYAVWNGNVGITTLNDRGGLAMPDYRSTSLMPAAAQGDDWTLAVDIAGEGSYYLEIAERDGSGTNLKSHLETPSTPAPGGERRVYTVTFTEAGTALTSAFIRADGNSQPVFTADAVQLEKKDHATSFAMGDMGTGYSWAGTPYESASIREEATITVPCALPAEAAVRYSEDDGDTWDVAYVTTFSGNNVGTYGRLHHDGSNLVLSSERRTRFGPVFAFSTPLTVDERTTLESTTTWTLDLIAPTLGQYIVSEIVGTDTTAPVVTIGGGD